MTPDNLPPEKLGPEIQRDVQRHLGRCMLRLQQYENALKTLLAHHEAAGTVEEIKAQPAIRAEKLSGQTLGNLANLMFESFVVPEGFERELLPEDKVVSDKILFSHSSRVTLAPEQWLRMKAAVQQLVTMRNGLVHGFLQRFNLWDEQGCADALVYLQEAFQRIESHYQELRMWAMCMVQGRALAASFMQTDVWQDWVVDGISPDGSFEWCNTGIVRALREEVSALAGKAWISFDVVKARMLERHPEQTPQKYRCSSWPQVLHESGEIELAYRRNSDTGPRQAWVRLRPESPPGRGAKERKRPGRGALTLPEEQPTEPG